MGKLEEKKVDSVSIYDGVIVKLFRDTAELPNGKQVAREVIRHCGAVCVVPINENGEVVLVEQFRYPFSKTLIEVPAGKLDIGEDPYSAALRELREETGYVTSELISLGEYYPSPAILDEVIHIYLATDLSLGSQALDDDEFLEVLTMPLQKACELVIEGKIPDGKTQVALLKAREYLYNNK